MTDYEDLAVNIPDDQLWENCVSAYKNRDFKFLDNNWRFLTSSKRLRIIYESYKDGIGHFITPKHFELYQNDFNMLDDAIRRFCNIFGISQADCQDLYLCQKYKEKIRRDDNTYEDLDPSAIELLKSIGLYVRLKEYYFLTKKYPCFQKEMIGKNIIKCNPLRTKARIAFLLEINNGIIPDQDKFFKDLTSTNIDFNMTYEKEIAEKSFFLERGTSIYSTLADMVNVMPDFAYDKFLELALRAVYGEKQLLNAIYKKRKEVARALNTVEQKEKVNEDIASDEPLEGPDFIEKLKIDELDDFDDSGFKGAYLENYMKNNNREDNVDNDIKAEVEELFDNAFPTMERDEASTGKKSLRYPRNKPNKIEKFDQNRVEAFLNDLHEIGIECEGCVTSNSGCKTSDLDEVRYYVLKKGDYVILEPIGQVGNSTLVMKNNESIEELGKLIKESKKELIKKDLAFSMNHKRTENQEYQYSIYAIQNIVTIIDELKNIPESPKKLTIADLKREITNLIPKEEIPEASDYIMNINGLMRLAEYVARREGKISEKKKKAKERNE